jgi:gamma-glutamyltranspeptidase/glutathione hydrolase
MSASFQSPYHTQHWQITKPVAAGRDGIVVAQNREAAEAGVSVLNAGGNAADAAMATAFALSALEPWNSGLGGIGFAIVLPAGERAASVVDFGPVSSRRTQISDYPLTGATKNDFFTWPAVVGDRNIHGPLSFCVPSSVAGYASLHERFGSGMALREIMAPAIALARRGVAQDWFTTLKIASSAAVLRLYEESARVLLPNGLPPVPPYQGETGFFRLGQLPTTLERLAEAGLEDFYTGGVALDVVSDIRKLGGVIDAADLAECRTQIRPAPTIAWRDKYLVHTAGGLTAAPTLAEVIAGMSEVPRPITGPDGGWFSTLATVMRRAYAARLAGLGAVNSASKRDESSKPDETCTTHLTVVDREGTLVSVTTTLLSSMGSRVMLPTTGILMNNGMMWFDPRPGSPNQIAPGTRPLNNMCPVIVTSADGGWPKLAAGASGGRRILASVYQTLAFALDFNMDVGATLHAPRIDVSGPDAVTADMRLPDDVLAALAADGPLKVVEQGVLPINFACPNLIMLNDEGAQACSDVSSPWSAAVAVPTG